MTIKRNDGKTLGGPFVPRMITHSHVSPEGVTLAKEVFSHPDAPARLHGTGLAMIGLETCEPTCAGWNLYEEEVFLFDPHGLAILQAHIDKIRCQYVDSDSLIFDDSYDKASNMLSKAYAEDPPNPTPDEIRQAEETTEQLTKLVATMKEAALDALERFIEQQDDDEPADRDTADQYEPEPFASEATSGSHD